MRFFKKHILVDVDFARLFSFFLVDASVSRHAEVGRGTQCSTTKFNKIITFRALYYLNKNTLLVFSSSPNSLEASK